MAKRARAAGNKERPQRYGGAIAIAWLLTLMLAAALTLVVLREHLLQALSDVLPGGAGSQADDVLIVAVAAAGAIATPTVAAAATAVAIRALRLTLYQRRLHAHAASYLRRHAPLHGLGVIPGVVALDESGAPSAAARPASLTRRLGGASAILLLGESGAGKTAALYDLASTLTRKRTLAARVVSRRHLPVLISPGTIGPVDSVASSHLVALVAAQLRHFGSAGFAARAEQLLRRGRIVLLCDDIDAEPFERRSEAPRQLAALIEAYPRTPVVATCRLETYRDGLHAERSLSRFERLALSGLTATQITTALRSLPSGSSATRPRRHDVRQTLHQYALDTSAAVPAGLQAIRVLLGREELVAGRGEVMSRYAGVLLGATTADELERQRAEALLAALAAGLRRREERSVHLEPDMSSVERVLDLVESALELASPASPAVAQLVSTEVAGSALAAALEAGILVRTAEGERVAFANGVIEATFAARWLSLADDGFGALRAELLRPEWMLPLALRATSVSQPGDLAKRILRLADTPDAVALRAGLSSPTEAVPLILAVALAVLAEGTVAGMARESASDGVTAEEQPASLASEHLRDVLDLAHIYLAQPEGADGLAAQLRVVSEHVGPEFVAALAQLANDTRLSRLVRSQLIALLGLASDQASVDALARLLEDMDPLVRQAVNQAFVHAGPAGLARLRRATQTQGGRLRERAGEVMALLGDEGLAAAMELLSHPDEARRVTAALTLGELRAAQAEAALVRRLTDRSSDVRLAAVRALARIGTVGARDALHGLLTSGDPRLRAAGAEALGSLRAEDAVKAISHLLDDPSPGVRAAAARALGTIGDDSTADALETRLSDADPWVRQAVESALRRLGRAASRIGSPNATPA